MAFYLILTFISVHALITARYLPSEAGFLSLENSNSDTEGEFKSFKLFPETVSFGKPAQNIGDAVKICVFNKTGDVQTMDCRLYRGGMDILNNKGLSTTNEQRFKRPVDHNTMIRTVYTTNIFNLIGGLKKEESKEYKEDLNKELNLIVEQKNTDGEDYNKVKIFGESEEDNSDESNYDLDYKTQPDILNGESGARGKPLRIYFLKNSGKDSALNDLLSNIDNIRDIEKNMELYLSNGSANNEKGKTIDFELKDEPLSEENITKNVLDLNKTHVNEDMKDNKPELQNESTVDIYLDNNKLDDESGKVEKEIKKGKLKGDEGKIDMYKYFNQIIKEGERTKYKLFNDSNNPEEVVNIGTNINTKQANKSETKTDVEANATNNDILDNVELNLNNKGTNRKIFDTLEGENENVLKNVESELKNDDITNDLVNLNNATNEKVFANADEIAEDQNSMSNNESNLSNKDINKVLEEFESELKNDPKNRNEMDNNGQNLHGNAVDNKVINNKLDLNNTDSNDEPNNELDTNDKHIDGKVTDIKLEDNKDHTNAVLKGDAHLDFNKGPTIEDSNDENKTVFNNSGINEEVNESNQKYDQDKLNSNNDVTKYEEVTYNEQGLKRNTNDYTDKTDNKELNIKELFENKLEKEGKNYDAAHSSEFENNLKKKDAKFDDILSSFMSKVSTNIELPNPSKHSTQ